MFCTRSPPNAALRNRTDGTRYLLTPGGNRQLYRRLHRIQAKTNNRTKHRNNTTSVPTPPLLRLEFTFQAKEPSAGTATCSATPQPRGTARVAPTATSGRAAAPAGARRHLSAPQRRPGPATGGSPSRGPPAPSRCPVPAEPRGASGPGGRRTESHLLRRCPAGGLRLFPALPGPAGDPAPAIAAAASQDGAGLPAGTSRRSQARWVWKPVTTCQDGVAPKPAAEAGRELVWTGEARPSLAQSAGQRLPRGAAGPPARPGPALPCLALLCAACRTGLRAGVAPGAGGGER